MIICCDQCDTEFNVPSEAIGPEGRAVRCSKCAHEWIAHNPDLPTPEPVVTAEASVAEPQVQEAPRVEPYQQEEELLIRPAYKAETKETIPAKPNVHRAPARRYEMPKTPIYDKPFIYGFAKFAAIASCALFLITCSLYYHESLIRKFSWLEKPFQAVGLYINHDLKLESVDCKINKVDTADNFTDLIEVEVVVSIKNLTDTPQILPVVRFSLFDVDKTFIGELALPINTVVPPGESTKVEGRLNRVPENSYFVGIDLGDKFDVVMRNPQLLFKHLHQ
ncbi:MAG: zinc-ribbon domain-containing protein [Rickettsiales bacterium]